VHRPLIRLSALVAAAVLAFLSTMPAGAQRAPARERQAAPAVGAANKFGLSQPLPRTKGAIRLATYNVLNLFDDADDPSLSGEFDDIKFTTSDDRCRAMAAAIRAIDADILALQEVESLEALKWFRDRYLADMGYAWVSSLDVGYFRGVECSVMSRFRIASERVWPKENLQTVRRKGIGWSDVPDRAPFGFQRSPLMVEIALDGGYELTLFIVHHKAGREFNWQREAEAIRAMELIEAERTKNPARNIVVMGDFNAAPWDKSARVYLEGGLIDTLAHRCTSRDIAECAQFKTHESDRVLDYILLNSAAHRELVIGSAFVLGTLHPGDQYDFRKDPHPPGYASDHYPVAIELIPKDAN
jgi:endonuclease/exonuclease/phosphatase family metal-dependent hydrolase